MDGDRCRSLLEPGASFGRERDRAVVHGGDGIPQHGGGLEPLLFLWLDFVGVEAEERNPVLGQERITRADARQLGGTVANQVRHAHRIEDARVGGVRRGQVCVTIEVDQAQIGLPAQQSGDDPKRDGAVSAQHQRNQAALSSRLHRRGDPTSNGRHMRHALLLAVSGIRLEPDRRKIAEIIDREPGLKKGTEQSRLSKGGRRLLLTRPVGTGAGGDPDQAEPGQCVSAR